MPKFTSFHIWLSVLLLLILIPGFECIYDTVGPTFVQEPPSKVEFINELGVRINCSAKGSPPPTIRWISNQAPVTDIPGLRYVSQEGSLILPPISRESFRPDAIYKCIAYNSFGTIVSTDVLVRGVPKQNFEPEVRNVNGLVGFPVQLECSVPSHLREHVTINSWIKDKSFLISKSSSNKYYITPEGQLIIWDLSAEDSYSSYQCQILNLLTGEAVTSSPGNILLRAATEVIGPPIIHHKTHRVRLKEDESLVLPCIAYGQPKPYVRWYRRMEYGLIQITESDTASIKVDVSSGGMHASQHALRINHAKGIHGGLYICNASNALGSDMMETQLYVYSPLQLELQPTRLNVSLGQSASFSCISSAPGDPQWMKDGVLLRDGSFSGRIKFIGKTKIQITDVVKEDQGVWQCFVKLDHEMKQSAAELRVGDIAVVFKYKFINQTVQQYQQVSFRCSASGSVKWTWTLDGFPLPQSDRFLIGQYTNVHGEVISHVNITAVRNSDSGEFACIGESEGGQRISHSGRLNVYGKLMIRPMSDIFTVGGKELRITCPVGGFPIDEIKWWKDDVTLPTNYDRQRLVGFKEGTLLVEKVDKKLDAGKYSCTAKRQDQKVEGTVLVNIKEPPVITKFTFPSVSEGERVSVSCVVRSGEVDSISWIKDNQIPLSVGSHQQKMKISVHHLDNFTSSLSIAKLDADIHNGNYTCLARNKLSTSNHTAALIVEAQPRISPFFFDDNVIEGMRSVEILCHSQGDDLSFHWYKDDSSLDMSSVGFKVINFSPFSSILTLTNISSDMTGNYSCEASNAKDSRDVFTAPLLVKDSTSSHPDLPINSEINSIASRTAPRQIAPKWITEPFDQSVATGSYLVVNCQASGFPKPSIKWQQAIFSLDSKEYREVGYRTPGILSVENGTMIIGLVKKEHEGTYMCEANNGIGATPLRKLIRLTVNAAPRMKARPPKEMAKMGSSARLVCQAEGDEPITFTWKLKGVSVDLTNTAKYLVTSGSPKSSELEINQVSSEDRGDYECDAANAFGNNAIMISLLVQEKPPTPLHFRALKEASRSVLLSWFMPTYEETSVLDFILSFREEAGNWSEEIRKKFIPGDQMTCTVDNLAPSTSYIFRISARNQMGSSEFSEGLKITTESEPPSGPPTYLTVEALSSQQLLVKWQPPAKDHRNGKILGYVVNYRRRSESSNEDEENWTNQLIPSETTGGTLSVVLRGLEKFTEYDVRVQAFNNKGRSPNSTLIVGVTREDVPSAPPMEVSCMALSSHNIQVTWQPPPKTRIHGRIQGYRVSVEAVDESDNSNTELESKVTGLSTVVHGLLHFTNYSVQVAALTIAGDGVTSAPIYCKTAEAVPEAPSTLKAVHDLEKSVVILSWLPPQRANGVLIHYHIYLRKLGAGGSQQKRTVSSHVWTYELTGLNSNDKYESWVTAETSIGEGPPGVTPVTFTLSPPSGPERKCIVSCGRVVTASWKSEVILHCVYTGIATDLIWKRKDQIVNTSQRVQILNNSSLYIKNCGRKDSDNYTCIVRQKHGSDRIDYNLQVQVPPGPPLLHSTFSDFTSVRLQWKVGDNGGSRILGFTVNFREENGEWEEIYLGRKILTHDMQDLLCGTMYEFYITANNKIGDGSSSKILQVNTKGLATFPPQAEFIELNSSTILLNFHNWNITECQITNLKIEYRNSKIGNWITVRNQDNLEDKTVQISDLSAETEYIIKIHLLKKSSKMSKEYMVTTLPLQGEPNSGNFSADTSVIFHNLSLILLLGILAIIIISTSIGAVILYTRKRARRLDKTETNSLSPHDNGQGFMKTHDFSVLHTKHYNEDNKIPQVAEDVCPYATFHLPEVRNFGGNADRYRQRHEELANINLVTGESTFGRRNCRRKGTLNTRKSDHITCSGESDEYDSYGSDSDCPSRTYSSVLMTPNTRSLRRENPYFCDEKLFRNTDWQGRPINNLQRQKHFGCHENHYQMPTRKSVPTDDRFIDTMDMKGELLRLEDKNMIGGAKVPSSKIPSRLNVGSELDHTLYKDYTINV